MDKGFENPEERDWLFCNVSVSYTHLTLPTIA